MTQPEKNISIYVVDDEEINCDLMQGILEDDYCVECFLDGESLLQRSSDKPADIVLLDVDMPGINGLEVCRQLQQLQPQVPVMFISAKSSNEERLAGYAAGGYDYIVKPCDPQELLAKIELICQQQAQQKRLNANNKETSDAFMEAIIGTGEMGILLRFAINSFAANDYQTLANLVLETLKDLGQLEASVLISGKQEAVAHSTQGPCPPIEEQILAMLKEKGRLYPFDQRLQVNEKNTSVLVKNMPEDEKQAGRLRDHLPLLLEVASACVDNIDTSSQLSSSLSVIETVQKVSGELSCAEDELRTSMFSFARITEDEMNRMERGLQFLALSEEQENKLQESISVAQVQVQKIGDEANDVCARFGNIVTQLKQLL